MKKLIVSALTLFGILGNISNAQDLKEKEVPAPVKAAFIKKYPDAKKVSWEKEKGNFEANWGGKSGEDNSAIFNSSAVFLEIVVALPINQLPTNIAPYIASHFNNAKIKEAGKLTDASGKQMFEVEIKGKDLIFDEKGIFMIED